MWPRRKDVSTDSAEFVGGRWPVVVTYLHDPAVPDARSCGAVHKVGRTGRASATLSTRQSPDRAKSGWPMLKVAWQALGLIGWVHAATHA